MPDDRFADLGPSSTRAGERLAELDEPGPEQPPPRRGRYNWVVGVAFVLLIIVVIANTGTREGRAISGPVVGEPIPRFAAPGAGTGLDTEANVNQSRSDPAPGETPACEVRVPGAIRSCDFTSKPLVLTFILPTATCERFVDRVERLRPRYPKVNFVTVVSGEGAPKKAKRYGWRQPVAVDKSGAVLTRYRLGLCVNALFVREGGVLRATKTEAQNLTDAQLEAEIRATVKG